MRITDDYVGSKFFTKINGKLWATPLFLALVTVEFTDVIFAIDSIPAIFAITTEPFLVFTSNIFAILGLRSLYFALSGLVQMFHYLSYGLAAILGFVGLKMIYGYVEKSIVESLPKFPVTVSLGVIGVILGVSIIASMRKPLAAQSP